MLVAYFRKHNCSCFNWILIEHYGYTKLDSINLFVKVYSAKLVFAKPKDPVLREQQTDAISSVRCCSDSDHEYIAKGTRRRRLFLSIKRKTLLSQSILFKLTTQLRGRFSKMITTNRLYHQHLSLEVWQMKVAPSPSNRVDGVLSPDTYLHLIN